MSDKGKQLDTERNVRKIGADNERERERERERENVGLKSLTSLGCTVGSNAFHNSFAWDLEEPVCRPCIGTD